VAARASSTMAEESDDEADSCAPPPSTARQIETRPSPMASDALPASLLPKRIPAFSPRLTHMKLAQMDAGQMAELSKVHALAGATSSAFPSSAVKGGCPPAIGGMAALREGGSSVDGSSVQSPITTRSPSTRGQSREDSFKTRDDATNSMLPRNDSLSRSLVQCAEVTDSGSERVGTPSAAGDATQPVNGTASEAAPLPSPSSPAALFPHLPEAVALEALKQAKQLPPVRIAAHEVVTTLGHSPAQAATFLNRFVGYAKEQVGKATAAAAADTWAPRRTPSDGAMPARDRAQKTVRSVAHACKGAASMVGAHRLTAASHALQIHADALGAPSPSEAEVDAARGSLELWKTELQLLLEVLETEDASKLVARTTGVLANSHTEDRGHTPPSPPSPSTFGQVSLINALP